MKQKIINLFNSLEETYFFPMGRRTWQALSFIGLATIILGVVLLLFNITPTFRDDVYVDKEEVANNEVIEEEFIEEISSDCDKDDYDKQIENLKVKLINCEFNDLGDSIERTKEAIFPPASYETGRGETLPSQLDLNKFEILKSKYNSKKLIRDYWGNVYELVTYKEFRPNMKAIPNQLNSLFDSKGIDSAEFCQKIELVKAISSYVEKFDFNYFDSYKIYRECFSGLINDRLDLRSINWSHRVMPIVVKDFDGIIAVREQHSQFKKIIVTASNDYISDDIVELSENIIEDHQEIEEPESDLDYKDYLDVIKTIDSYSDRDEDDLESAMDDFNDDIDYYDKIGFERSLSRYLGLYFEKVNTAELDKQARKTGKAAKRVISGGMMAGGFTLILLIGIILLLFSIQNILKRNVDES
jgi:hypothetical protein